MCVVLTTSLFVLVHRSACTAKPLPSGQQVKEDKTVHLRSMRTDSGKGPRATVTGADPGGNMTV